MRAGDRLEDGMNSGILLILGALVGLACALIFGTRDSVKIHRDDENRRGPDWL